MSPNWEYQDCELNYVLRALFVMCIDYNFRGYFLHDFLINTHYFRKYCQHSKLYYIAIFNLLPKFLTFYCSAFAQFQVVSVTNIVYIGNSETINYYYYQYKSQAPNDATDRSTSTVGRYKNVIRHKSQRQHTFFTKVSVSWSIIKDNKPGHCQFQLFPLFQPTNALRIFFLLSTLLRPQRKNTYSEEKVQTCTIHWILISAVRALSEPPANITPDNKTSYATITYGCLPNAVGITTPHLRFVRNLLCANLSRTVRLRIYFFKLCFVNIYNTRQGKYQIISY